MILNPNNKATEEVTSALHYIHFKKKTYIRPMFFLHSFTRQSVSGAAHQLVQQGGVSRHFLSRGPNSIFLKINFRKLYPDIINQMQYNNDSQDPKQDQIAVILGRKPYNQNSAFLIIPGCHGNNYVEHESAQFLQCLCL